MLITQWLLIGGPQHKQTVWIKGGVKTVISQNHSYESRDYRLDGKTYRVGICNPTDQQLYEVPDHIREIKLEAFDAP